MAGLLSRVPAKFVVQARVEHTKPCLSMQVHDDPTTSPVDGPTQWPLR